MKSERVQKLCGKMKEYGVDQVIVTSKANVFYFSGAYMDPMRRLLALIINADGSAIYYVNRLFHVDPSVKADLVLWDDTQDPTQLMGKAIKEGGTVVVDQDWQARFLLGLMTAQPNARYVNMPKLVDDLRMIKDEEELDILTTSSLINDKVLAEIFENISNIYLNGRNAVEINKDDIPIDIVDKYDNNSLDYFICKLICSKIDMFHLQPLENGKNISYLNEFEFNKKKKREKK